MAILLLLSVSWVDPKMEFGNACTCLRYWKQRLYFGRFPIQFTNDFDIISLMDTLTLAQGKLEA